MVGIEVGASHVTFSSGEAIPLGSGIPRDLLPRVATSRPYVCVDGHSSSIESSEVIYASAIADALNQSALSDRTDHDDFGRAPVALAVPGWWTPRTLARVRRALSGRSVDVALINDAEAAVAGYQHSEGQLPDRVAVVSLRANHVGVVIVRDCASRSTALVSPVLVHEEGGDDLDMGVLQHAVRGLADLGEAIDASDPQVTQAARDALRDCRAVRERLSISASESLLPRLPNVSERIRIVRHELEEIATPWADAVVRTVSAAIEQCSFQVDTVLLVGGLAEMPLASQRLSADLGLEVRVPADPTRVTVRGAALLAAQQEQASMATANEGEKSLWRMLRQRASAWRSPSKVATTEPNDEVPRPDTVDTLLDPAMQTTPVTGRDASWIPGSPESPRLVRQR